MTINYGKRTPGGLTAANPGDTLYIPLQFYNDSGASISIGASLAVTDVEVFKNGGTVERATDSGYAILGDTGNFDSRTGFKGISVQLFNTADDTGFYDQGSQYWVAIDSVAVDSRTVRFWPAVFEIGTPRANVVEVAGDTGLADRLGKFASLVSSLGQIDTGTISGGFIPSNVRQIDGDTGAAVHLQQLVANGFNDTGINDRFAKIQSDVDTGLRSSISDLDTGLRDYITSFDTGITETIDRILADTDTGIQSGVNVIQIGGDTGAADVLSKFAAKLSSAGSIDTGTLAGTKAGTIDANVTDVNSVSVGGSGTGGDPWGPE